MTVTDLTAYELDDRRPGHHAPGLRLRLDPYRLALRLAELDAGHRELAAVLACPPATVAKWLNPARDAFITLARAHRLVDALNGHPVAHPHGHTVTPRWWAAAAALDELRVADVCDRRWADR